MCSKHTLCPWNAQQLIKLRVWFCFRRSGSVRKFAVSMGSKKQQHVDFFRKVILRRELIKYSMSGSVFIPFCGDGDLAKLYYKRPGVRKIFAADLDPDRTKTFLSRYPQDTHVATGDCDNWLFADDLPEEFSIADFDAYSHPYASFKTFWEWAHDHHSLRLTDRVVLFFTDGHRQAVKRTKLLIDPEGVRHKLPNLSTARRVYNFYMKLVILPWFTKTIRGWRIEQLKFYLRRDMIYWGAVISKS